MQPQDLQIIGQPPKGATHFRGCRILGAGRQQSLTSSLVVDGARQKHIELGHCSIEFVRKEWGEGMYQLSWHRIDKGGRIAVLGRSPQFEVVGMQAGAPATPAAPKKKKDTFAVRMRQMKELQEMNAGIVDKELERAQRRHDQELENRSQWMAEMMKLTTLTAEVKANARVAAAAPANGASGGMSLDTLLPVAKTIAKELGLDIGDLLPVAKKWIERLKDGDVDTSVWETMLKGAGPALRDFAESPIGLAIAEKLAPGSVDKYYAGDDKTDAE
jgi:hypothetical protein